jgi:hypothetical protein
MAQFCLWFLGWETYPRQAMPRALLNQMLHLVTKMERLWVMRLGTPSVRCRVTL